MARPERFELPTTKFVAWYSIQLSYGRALKPFPADDAAAQCITARLERPVGRRGIILIGAARVNLFFCIARIMGRSEGGTACWKARSVIARA